MDSLGYFVTIDADECRRLLGDAVVGRVSWVSAEHGIQVLPVNYGVVGEQIVLRVATGTVLEELASGVDVAFQVDDLDRTTGTGWAVLAQGTTARWTGEVPVITPWALGSRELAVAITPTHLSGRSVSADEAV